MEGWQWDWADRIRKVRRVVGLSQQDMCRLCGVRKATWSAWESGRNVPKEAERRRVAGILGREFGVCLDWLTAPDQQVSALLPRMDSNHQPPDWRFHPCGLPRLAAPHDPDPPESVSRHNIDRLCPVSHCATLVITEGGGNASTVSACRRGGRRAV